MGCEDIKRAIDIKRTDPKSEPKFPHLYTLKGEAQTTLKVSRRQKMVKRSEDTVMSRD